MNTTQVKSQTPPEELAQTSQMARHRARRDQLVCGLIALGLMAGVWMLQAPLNRRHQALVREIGPGNDVSMRSLAVNFPRLTLGGFRGILSMVLWYRAEEAKNNRQWAELESTYNILGKLQPYFTSVYIFNAWNQAYNLSAQWHSLDRKYKWVLDGLGHLYEGEEFNPRNPDLAMELGHMYFLKLGGSFERIYYRAHWRFDIAHQFQLLDSQAASAQDTLGLVGNVLKDPRFGVKLLSPPGKPAQSGYGVEIDGTKYRFGLSPYYFAYVEYRRALTYGKPTNMSLTVLDAYPAMSLRLWCRDDAYYSAALTRDLFLTPNLPEADFDSMVLEARDCYRNIATVSARAVDEFKLHLQRYPRNEAIHRKHLKESLMLAAVGRGQSAMLEALVSWKLAGYKLTPPVKFALEQAQNVLQETIKAMEAYDDTAHPQKPGQVNPDRLDFARYPQAIQGQIKGLAEMVKLAPEEKPNLSFLSLQAVEK